MCYWVVTERKSYQEAQQACSDERPGQLAVIDSQDVYDFLVDNVPAFTPKEP